MSEIESTVAPEAEQADSATVEPVEPAEPVEATAPAKATHDEITKKILKNKYDDIKFKSEVDKVFPKDDTIIYECTNVKKLLSENGINAIFNEVFSAREPPITVNNDNKVYVYRDENGIAYKSQNRSIKIVCAAYFTTNKIIIASRLHEKHMDDEKEIKKSGGGIAAMIKNAKKKRQHENQKSQKNIMEDILNHYINGTDKVYNIEDKLTEDFKNKLKGILALKKQDENKFAEDSTVYKEIVISKSISKDISKSIIKFSVNFNIIYDDNKNSIYYSINTDFDEKSITEYTSPIFKLQPLAAQAQSILDRATPDLPQQVPVEDEAPAAQDAAAAGLGSTPSVAFSEEVYRGGGKRKLTRKQLNIMTLTELKQLHKVNKIKMNNNRTIKALINNYIKNYKKKIISNTKIGR